MKRLFRFNREEDDFGTRRWYIDLPEWEGFKADLEMVSGADIMLDKLSGSDNFVDCVVSNDDIVKVEPDVFLVSTGSINDGYYEIMYCSESYKSLKNTEVWLCEVTKFVFGYYPENIYLKVV